MDINGFVIKIDNLLDITDISYETLALTAGNVASINDIIQIVSVIAMRGFGAAKKFNSVMITAVIGMAMQTILLMYNFNAVPNEDKPQYGNMLKGNYIGLILGLLGGLFLEYIIIKPLKNQKLRESRMNPTFKMLGQEPKFIEPFGPGIASVLEIVIPMVTIAFGMSAAVTSYNNAILKGEPGASLILLGFGVSLIDWVIGFYGHPSEKMVKLLLIYDFMLIGLYSIFIMYINWKTP